MAKEQYVLTDGDRFIFRNHKGKYIPMSGESTADIYTKKQATDILEHRLSKPLKARFRVEKYDKPIENLEKVTKVDIKNNTEKVMISENIQKWINKISDLNGLAKELVDRKNELNQSLSEVDKEIQDCLHYIEFTKLNAAQGYKIYKLLKDRQVNRRSIKNELQVLDIIFEKKISESVTEEIIKKVSKMDCRNYKPKVLQELFDL